VLNAADPISAALPLRFWVLAVAARQTEQTLSRGSMRANGFPHQEQVALVHLLRQLEHRRGGAIRPALEVGTY
jgi:hypothetical protein